MGIYNNRVHRLPISGCAVDINSYLSSMAQKPELHMALRAGIPRGANSWVFGVYKLYKCSQHFRFTPPYGNWMTECVISFYFFSFRPSSNTWEGSHLPKFILSNQAIWVTVDWVSWVCFPSERRCLVLKGARSKALMPTLETGGKWPSRTASKDICNVTMYMTYRAFPT